MYGLEASDVEEQPVETLVAAAEKTWRTMVHEQKPLEMLQTFLNGKRGPKVNVPGIDSTFPDPKAMGIEITPDTLGDYVLVYGGTIAASAFELIDSVPGPSIIARLMSRGCTCIQAGLLLLCDIILRLAPNMRVPVYHCAEKHFGHNAIRFLNEIECLSTVGVTCTPFSVLGAFTALLRLFATVDVQNNVRAPKLYRELRAMWINASPNDRRSQEWQKAYQERIQASGFISDDMSLWTQLTGAVDDLWPEKLAASPHEKAELRHARYVIAMMEQMYRRRAQYRRYAIENIQIPNNKAFALAALYGYTNGDGDFVQPMPKLVARLVFCQCLAAMVLEGTLAMVLREKDVSRVFLWDKRVRSRIIRYSARDDMPWTVGLNMAISAQTGALLSIPSTQAVGVRSIIDFKEPAEDGVRDVAIFMPALLIPLALSYTHKESRREESKKKVLYLDNHVVVPGYICRAIMPKAIYKNLVGNDMSLWSQEILE